jgi:hypothetical protein
MKTHLLKIALALLRRPSVLALLRKGGRDALHCLTHGLTHGIGNCLLHGLEDGVSDGVAFALAHAAMVAGRGACAALFRRLTRK